MAGFVGFCIIYFVTFCYNRYFGVSFVRRNDYSNSVKENKIYSSFAKESNDTLKKDNPKLYIKASQNLKRKGFASTYSNFDREINKIKNNTPEWVKKEKQNQAIIIRNNHKQKLEQLDKKYNKKN